MDARDAGNLVGQLLVYGFLIAAAIYLVRRALGNRKRPD